MSIFSKLKKQFCKPGGKSGTVRFEAEEMMQKLASLTPREYEAYLILIEGHPLKESAATMGVKYPTMNTYSTSIYRKLGVRIRSELIVKYRSLTTEE